MDVSPYTPTMYIWTTKQYDMGQLIWANIHIVVYGNPSSMEYFSFLKIQHYMILASNEKIEYISVSIGTREY